MNSNFSIYFDIINKQEIISFRKIKKGEIIDSNDKDVLNNLDINEAENPLHIIYNLEAIRDKSLVSNFICKKLYIDVDSENQSLSQPIGTFLLDFLNLNLKDFNYIKQFILKYGIDIFSYLDKSLLYNLYSGIVESNFDINLSKVLDKFKNKLITLQNDFIDSLKFCFKNSDDSKINELTPIKKYYLSYNKVHSNGKFTYIPKLQKYSKDITLNFNPFFDKDYDLSIYTEENLLPALSKDTNYSASYSYDCANLGNGLFISFMNLLNIPRLNIKNCSNCNKYFIPSSRSDEKFCINPILLGSNKTCRDVGAFNKYNRKLKDTEIDQLIKKITSKFSTSSILKK